MHRPLLVLFALLICAFVVAACGGDDDVDVQEVLRQTFAEDKDIKSGRLDVSLRLDAEGSEQLRGPVTARLSGPFASTGSNELPRFAFEANLDAGGQSIRAGATSTGDEGFVSFQGQAYQLSDQLFQQFKQGYAEEARKSNDDGEGVSFQSLGVDPQRWLRDPEFVDRQEVGGTETLHIRSGIDIPRLLEDVNKVLGRAEAIQGQQARQLTEKERAQIQEAITDADLELWTGEDDKILRRLNVRLAFDVPEERRQRAQGLSSGVIRFELGLGAINEEQTIDAPENARPLDELLQAIQGGAQAGPGGTGSGGQPAPPPEDLSPYEQCVAEAGGDVAKLQECAGLPTS
ncbi:MAG TPA: hypothetical protein VGR12_05965 [Solirubrobacteraceae bacterium]|nr:hypothetical protein [Solirubrobacteraceae bacterium]